MISFFRRALSGSLISLAMSCLPALAATVDTTFDVTITLNAACEINGAFNGDALGAGDLDFGTHPATIVSDIDADNAGTPSAGIAVLCSDGLAYDVGLDQGLNENLGVRRMAGTSDFVEYELYQDAARTTPWGDLASGDELSATGNGLRQTYTVYGRVPAGQAPVLVAPPETFTDTITVTVEF